MRILHHIFDYLQGAAAVALAWITVPNLTALVGLAYILVKTYVLCDEKLVPIIRRIKARRKK